MNVLVIGNGGREHAILLALRKSKRVEKLYCMKGNAGTAQIAENVDVDYMNVSAVKKYVSEHPEIDYIVVAPDDPLAIGLVDELEAMGKRCFGPRKNAAIIEASKAFSKNLMKKYNIPTAESEIFSDYDKALQYIRAKGAPIVLKADGLALGKGVIICQNEAEALAAVDEIMLDKKFGAAGNEVVIEQFLTGYEVSLLTFVDGVNYKLMPTSCDHKRALDGDKGLNTGGMGAYSPCPIFTKELLDKTVKTVVEPTIAAMIKEGAPFKGVLYFGLMVDGDDVRVLEYNARFGDPETQSVLPLLKSDLYEIFNAVIDGTLDRMRVEWSDKKSINVVLASGGYPLGYKKGCPISGLTEVDNDVNVFFAGVKRGDDGLVTSGGRVLCVQAAADDFATARKKVYDNIRKIKFEDCYYRKDIGAKLAD